MNLLEKIQQLCEQKGITLYKLEQETDLTKGSIRKWDTSSPSSDRLLRVARYFDVPMESLLDDNNVRLSVPYRFVKKLIDVTINNSLNWCSFKELKDEDDYSAHPNAADVFDLHKIKEFSGNMFSFNDEDAYFTSYKNGGYAIIKIRNSEKKDNICALFVLCNSTFFLYATDRNLALLETLFEAVKTKAAGVDDLISEFLNDDFESKDKPQENAEGSPIDDGLMPF